MKKYSKRSLQWLEIEMLNLVTLAFLYLKTFLGNSRLLFPAGNLLTKHGYLQLPNINNVELFNAAVCVNLFYLLF